MEATKIAWTATVLPDGTVLPGYTFNPWMGCTKVSPGCAHCYAETLTKNRMGLALWGSQGRRQVTSVENWRKPLRWNRQAEAEGLRRRVFCASLCDIFEDHPVAEKTRPRLWELIRNTPWLDWQLLTKRADRIARCLPADWGAQGWGHVWLGVSIESNDFVERADHLRAVPAVVRFISYEPALGPLDKLALKGIDWLIVGGESGPGFRPMNVQWTRDMWRQCQAAGVAYFFKQGSHRFTERDITLDGKLIRNYPMPRRGLPPIRGNQRPPANNHQATDF